MAITRFRNSSILNRGPKYNDFLAGLPFRPIIGTATDGGTGTTVSVAFTGNNSAGAGVTYTALSSPGNITATGPASPITVSGLTSGTAYTFQVKAGNSLGDSAYSASSNSVTPAVPTSFESIATVTVGSGGAANVTFSSIGTDWTHLQVRGIGRSAENNSGFDNPWLRFNSDTGSNYNTHRLYGNGSAAAADAFSNTHIRFGFFPLLNDSPAQAQGAVIIDILDYKDTNKNKTVRLLTGSDLNGSGFVALQSGLWRNTNAITSITLLPSGGNWAQYTTFALYGIKGA